MDGHGEDLPSMEVAPAVDQQQMASTAAPVASSGVGMDQLALMQSAAAATATATAAPSGAADGDHGDKLFDIQVLENFVAQHDWDNVEKQLKELVSVKEGVDPVREHAYLFIPVYEEWMTDLIEKQHPAAALNIFTDKVSVLYYDIKSEYVNEEDLKQQVSRLHKIANFLAPAKAASVENVLTTLTDYIHLYFPILLGHRKQADRPSHLWRFAKMVKKPRGQKETFRCLACGELFKNCSISKMREHLDITTGGKTCSKLTRNLQRRFQEGEKQKGKVPKHHGPVQSSPPSGHAKVRQTADLSLVIQETPPAAEEGTADDILVAKLVQSVHATAEILHIASVGKPLHPKVEEQLRAARDLLSVVLSQKAKHS